MMQSKVVFTLFLDSSFTGKKILDSEIKYQVDIGSSQKVERPKYLIAAQHSAARLGVPNKRNNIGNFENINVRKKFDEVVGIRHPTDSVSITYVENDYLFQYRDIEIFYKDFIGEELLSPSETYPVLKNFYAIQLIDLRLQVDHENPKKNQLIGGFRVANFIARLFMVIIRHKEIKMVS